jgi:hypothetical protein
MRVRALTNMIGWGPNGPGDGPYLAGPKLDATGRPHISVVAPLDDTWQVVYDLIAHPPGQLALIELRIIPRVANPTSGLTSATYRGVRVRDYVRYLEPILGWLRGPHPNAARHAGWLRKAGFGFLLDGRVVPRTSTGRTRQGPGRPRLSDLMLARMARAYLDALARDSSRPVLDAAARLGEKPERVRDLLHRARLRGLLEGATSGAAGGTLTARGRALLDEQSERAATKRRKAR